MLGLRLEVTFLMTRMKVLEYLHFASFQPVLLESFPQIQKMAMYTQLTATAMYKHD